jgi:hypothetical protein
MNSVIMAPQILLLDGGPADGTLLSFQQITLASLRKRYLSNVLYKCRALPALVVKAHRKGAKDWMETCQRENCLAKQSDMKVSKPTDSTVLAE